MGEKIGSHECAVRMTRDSYPLTVGNAHFDDLIYGSRSIAYELFNEGIIGLIISFSDYWKTSVVKYSISLSNKKDNGTVACPFESVGRPANLARCIRAP